MAHKVLALVCLLVSVCGVLRAASRSGSTTEIRVVDGRPMQRSITNAERNPLPATGSEIERQRSVPLPRTDRIQSGTRWVTTDAAAIGQDVAVDPTGGYQFIGWNLNNLRVSFHDNASGVPGWEFQSDPQTYRNFVALSADAGVVANASYHHIFLFDKVNGSVVFDYPVDDGHIAGPVAVSRNGSLLVCALLTAAAGGTNLIVAFHPPSTTPVWTAPISDEISSGITGVTISADNGSVAAGGRFHGWVLNAADGNVRTHFPIDNTESRIALSGDASVLAVAENSGFLKTFGWNAAATRYDLLWQYKIPAGSFTNWASAVDVSADGLTVAAGSLLFLGADYDGSVYLFDTYGDGLPNWIYTGAGDLVDEVALSDDGSILSAVTWGDLAQTKPDILVFERSSNIPVYSVITNGSMFSLAMSPDGSTVVAGGKAVHARQFGSGGQVYNIQVDLGGGAVTGTVTLPGANDNAGAVVEVQGTTRTSTTAADGSYIIEHVPPGTYSVRFAALGFVGTTTSGVTVFSGDTTTGINATLSPSGAAPTNLAASHSLDSRITLAWSNPTNAELSAWEHRAAADPFSPPGVLAAHGVSHALPPKPAGVVPPDSIRIYRAIRSGGPYYYRNSLAGTVAAYTDSAVLPLKDYYYRVTAVYGSGESVYSNEAFGSVDSSYLQFAVTAPHRTVTPTFDGVLSPGEWDDALKLDVSDVFGNGGGIRLPRASVFMYLKYDSTAGMLYVAGEDLLNNDGLDANEGFGLYFDDNNNDQYEPSTTDPRLREGNYWAYYFSAGPTVRFREIFTGGGVTSVIDTVSDASVAMSNSAGHFTGEVGIPISFFNKNHLQVFAPNRTVGAGLFLISRTAGVAVFHGWWPQTMNSVFTPYAFGDITIPIHLLAPPRAPGNVQVLREGTRLHVTWTDPAQGINNDPLSLPPTLELTRNGAVIGSFPAGVQSYVDSSVAPQGWYEYRLRAAIDVPGQSPQTLQYGPYSPTVGAFAVSDPELTEMRYDDGSFEVFYVVDFTYDNNKFAIRFTPDTYPVTVYRVKAFTNNGNSPIDVEIHADSLGFPGRVLAGPYRSQSNQTSGVDSLIATIPGTEPPVISNGDFHVVLSYLPSSPGAPGIGGDATPPSSGRSVYYTNASGWTLLPGVNLMVRAFVAGPTVGVVDAGGLPVSFDLAQNYPNPFNPTTVISYAIAATSQVRVNVMDILGRDVATLVNEQQAAGRYTLQFDGHNLASGVYFFSLTAGNFSSTRKMMLVR